VAVLRVRLKGAQRARIRVAKQERNTAALPARTSDTEAVWRVFWESGAPGEARTPGLMIRSHSLYPTELRARVRLPIIRMRQSVMASNGRETEVKIRLHEVDGIPDRLRASGFGISEPRIFEANTLYDTAEQTLRLKDQILRLRQVGNRVVLTWKGPGEAGPHKDREERETGVESFPDMHLILERLGYVPTFRYEKFRTEFQQVSAQSKDSDSGVVTLDETPIGTFLELEGPGAWIDKTAQFLGFSKDDYILDSYGRLYLAHCARHGLQPGNMVFASQ
jgi:adenylate cyclase, class 2